MTAVHRLAAAERIELQRIGANLNQVARALHSGAVQVPAGTLEAVERVADLVADLPHRGGAGLMIAKVHALGRSFAGVAAYCLHDAPERNEGERPETAERVEWADTRNLASRPERAAAQMAATAKAAPELKRLAGVSAAGRKLEKPVLHYTLSWGKDERPDRAEMNRAAEETLKALGLKRHQALIVAHRDKDHPHLHMIANRVNPETGKAAKLGNDRLKLSRWAERWERERGQVKCPERAKNKPSARRAAST